MIPSHLGQVQQYVEANYPERVNSNVDPNDYLKLTPANTTDDAVGVDVGQWHVAWVNSRSEKKVRDNLLSNNIEAYVAVRRELHTWRRNEKRVVERVLIPCIVFVKAQKSMFNTLLLNYGINSFMKDPARGKGSRGVPYAIINEKEMALLKSMVSQDQFEVSFENSDFSLGEHVRILGFEAFEETAQIVRLSKNRTTYVGVRVGFLGCAYMEVPREKIIKIKK